MQSTAAEVSLQRKNAFKAYMKRPKYRAAGPPPSKTYNEKRSWVASQKQKYKEANDAAQNSGFTTPWAYKCAIIVERPQVLTPEPEPWFAQYNEWRNRWDTPILAQYPNITVLDQDIDDLKKAEEKEKKAKAQALDPDRKQEKAAAKDETDEERIEREEKEKRAARIAAIRAAHETTIVERKRSRTTAADETGDMRSLYRALDKRLFLIVKKPRGDHAWQFPQGLVDPGETLRQTAEREFKEECNTDNTIETHFIGNCPVGFFTYNYPPAQQKEWDTYGSKVFFYYAFFVDGQVSISKKELEDFRWVTKDELKDFLEPNYLSSIWDVLPSDGKHESLERMHYLKKEKE